MPRYRFSETVVYKSGSPWPEFKAGSVYDLPSDFGNRWVRRSVATADDGGDVALPDPRFAPPVAPAAEPAAEIATAPAVVAETTAPDAPRFIRNRR